ncbi:glutaminase A [Aeromicrobium phragmitis]|uniref:Glutaminase n=1 Tax=Aeromicrobium phragmitis TaxID=2478914 RepID=A0A3L8PKS0_9ACTN|nr:glutaminase A [Aeromicrobium phragmitis]RLV54652.1 glutaminase A [Aeromicrobium phragmitis]
MDSDPVGDALTSVLDDLRGQDEGELSAENAGQSAASDLFALVLVGPFGDVHAAGDAEHRFTVQSIAKAFAFALALQSHGPEAVFERVGLEPTGEPFHAISVAPDTGRPANPMINAGALVTTSMAPGDSADDKVDALVSLMSRCAGRELEVDEEFAAAEAESSDHNRGIAYVLASLEALACPVETALETYFRQCAVRVDARDVATMAATLAFGGRNPVTGDRVMDAAIARDVVSVMASCGMYDASGEWVARVGLPAKSGVSGGIIAVDPSEFGVAVFSPRLDSVGNSTRGVRALEELSRRFGLHMFADRPETSAPLVNLVHEDDRTIVRLQGHIGFGTAVQVAHRLREEAREGRAVALDMSDADRLDDACGTVLRRVAEDLDAEIAD